MILELVYVKNMSLEIGIWSKFQMLFTVCLARLKMFKASGVFVCLFGGIDV
jgi:hypothetical protein